MFSLPKSERFIYKIHLINVTPEAGATTLLNALVDAADKKFSMGDDFTVAVLLKDGKQTHMQIWDDTKDARCSVSYDRNVDAEIFICDLSNPALLQALPRKVAEYNILYPRHGVEMLVASKSDAQVVKDDELNTVAKKLGFNTVIKVSSEKDNKELLLAIRATIQQYHDNHMIALLQKNNPVVKEIDKRIKELKLDSSEVAGIKIQGLQELRKNILSNSDKSLPDMIADIREKYPRVDEGVFSDTKAMLDRFIAECAETKKHTY